MNRATRYLLGINILLILFSFSALSQVPARPVPERLVNDKASIFSQSQINSMEKKLVEFSGNTSNQIVVLTVNDLGGMPISQFAYQVGEKWGVGKSGFNNGIVVVVKPKTGRSDGEVYIAVGYGLEPVIPDVTAKRIIEREMIPYFRDNNYYQGVLSALNILMQLAQGEFSYKEYEEDDGSVAGAIIGILFIAFITFIVIASAKKGGGSGMGSGGRKNMSGLDMFLLGTMMGSSGRRSGGSGGGFSGGSRGGFGGFGGGSFGGGGAGGRW